MFRQRFLRFLDARSVSATTPSTALTLTAGEVWEGFVTMRGSLSAGVAVDLLIRIGATKVGYWGLTTASAGAGVNQTISTGMIKLAGGTTGQTFTIEATNPFVASSGDLLVYGITYRA